MKKLVAVVTIFLSLVFYCSAQTDQAWYRTQVGTGVGNCGPATVAMAIVWSTQKDVPVETVRDYIGYQRSDGATDLMELAVALRKWKATFDIEVIDTLPGLKDLVKRKDMIVIVLIDTSGISEGKPADIFGKNYDLEVGHYIILTDVISNYFVVQDPMPGGSDRRYKIQEVWNSLKSHRMIIVRNLQER